jgi:FlaA1/EpsC-like NDP-sugar epimerase
MLHKKSILITGAAGTIGKALSFQAIHLNAEKIILLDNAETPLYNLEQEISLKFHALLDIEYVLMDVKDERSMEALFERLRPEIIFHVAAYKHVPVLEKNPITAVVNNVLGTKILADLSVKYHVGKFIFISTDKAINPSSIMGATKLIGEKYIVALS